MTDRNTGLGVLVLAMAAFAMSPVIAGAKGKPADKGKASSEGPRVVRFAGHDWLVKGSGRERVGPGPNLFSDRETNVWVDDFGRLHLRVSRSGKRWYAAEVVSTESFGHGLYRFYLDTPTHALAPSVVLGLFTWNDDPAFAHREIDIEFSRWSDPANPVNAQYVVQPYDLPGNLVSFVQPALAPTTHTFDWQPSAVSFRSLVGFAREPSTPNDVIAEWTYDGDVPQAGGENARINLWMFRGEPPADGRPAEVIVSDFEFVP